MTGEDWQAVFLRTLAEGGGVEMAAEAAGVTIEQADKARLQSPQFLAQWNDAVLVALSLERVRGAFNQLTREECELAVKYLRRPPR